MIAISPQSKELDKEVVAEPEYAEEGDSSFYVEKDTGLLYETKFFPEFALIRMVMPDFQTPINRIDLMSFADLFEEYCGDAKELRSMLFGSAASHILISKKKKNDWDG